MTDSVLRIQGMHCDHCVRTVSLALGALDGVAESNVRLDDGEAHVRFNELKCDPGRLVEAVRAVGYQVVGFTKKE